MNVMSDWLVSAELAPNVENDPLRPLYDAAARGELALPFCGSCKLTLELEQYVCDGCGRQQPDWQVVVPEGVVHCSTVVHRREPGLVLTNAPYPVVDVELASGHRLIMTTLHPAAGAPAIGTPVQLTFRRLGMVHIPAVANSAETTELGEPA
ncbi:Zn-ribbon domain-containing OB-fold protein [Mycobacterium sp. HUMS_1102779]|uniref:Zn-ribbon domain-containing OB-fold protein n=1 Tax=Mycobacterium sp. HUMS_1102779 TaxID=3383487 RepID=UPI00389B22B9